MPDILASCSACGRSFVAGQFGADGMALGIAGQSVYIEHLESGPGGVQMQGVAASCPYCGGVGNIPDGTYQYVRDGLRVLRQLTPAEARDLLQALKRYQDGAADEAEVQSHTPAAAVSLVRRAVDNADKKFWITILLTILLYVLSNRSASQDHQQLQQQITQMQKVDEHQLQVEQEIAKMIQEAEHSQPQVVATKSSPSRARPPSTSVVQPEHLPNKNDPCWCGSGRSFKRCHKRSE